MSYGISFKDIVMYYYIVLKKRFLISGGPFHIFLNLIYKRQYHNKNYSTHLF